MDLVFLSCRLILIHNNTVLSSFIRYSNAANVYIYVYVFTCMAVYYSEMCVYCYYLYNIKHVVYFNMILLHYGTPYVTHRQTETALAIAVS